MPRNNNASKIVIVAIVGAAAAVAGFATWFHYWGTHRVIDFYGAQTALLVAEAPRIELLKLAPVSEDDPSTDANVSRERLTVGGQPLRVVLRHIVSKAPGIINIRRALVIDITYRWQEPPPASPHWQYAMEFSDDARSAMLLFDPDTHSVMAAGQSAAATLAATASDEIHLFEQETVGK